MKRNMVKLAAILFVVASIFTGMFSAETLTVQAAEQEMARYALIDLKNGTYNVNISLEAGEGISTIQPETTVFVEDKVATVVIVWDSTDYNYMKLDGEKFLPKSAEDGSVFWLPVTAWDEAIPVLVSRGAGSTEETECTLTLDSSTLKTQGTMAPLYALIILNMVLVFLYGYNLVKKRKFFVERVETEEEAKKFAKQYKRRTGQDYKPQSKTPSQSSGLVYDPERGFIPASEAGDAVAENSQNSSNEKAQQRSKSQPSSGFANGYQPQHAQPSGLWWRRSPDEPGTLVEIKKEPESEAGEEKEEN